MTENLRIEISPSISIGFGSSTKIKAKLNILDDNFIINWQRCNGTVENLQLDHQKYAGSSIDVSELVLVINNVDADDSGRYRLEVNDKTSTTYSNYVEIEVFGDPGDSATKEENNFLRMFLLCHKIGTEAVREMFNNHVPPAKLSAHLNPYQYAFGPKGRHKCFSQQFSVLFPGSSVVDSRNFDFTLLYKVIYCTLQSLRPSNGWGVLPSKNQVNKGDDLERIRAIRNDLAHRNELSITDVDFRRTWDELKGAIHRLSNGKLTKEADDCLTRKLDRHEKNRIYEKLKNNIQGILNAWKKDDEIYFYPQKELDSAFQKLELNKHVVISGVPGSGKSAMAKHIVLILWEKGFEVFPISDPQKIIEYADKDSQQVFLIDDALGTLSVEISRHNTFQRMKDKIIYVIGPSSKIIFTCRTSVYKEALRLKSFITENVIDLNALELSKEDKQQILRLHCQKECVPEKAYRDITCESVNPMFPLLCKLFSNKSKYQKRGRIFFEKPYDCLLDDFDEMQKYNAIQYASLIMCLFNDNTLSRRNIPSSEIKQVVFNNCGVNGFPADRNILDALKEMSGTYVSKTRDEYTFIHDCVMEMAAFHYGRDYPEDIIKYTSSNFISNRIDVGNRLQNGELYTYIESSHYKTLADRLFDDISYLKFDDVFRNTSLHYKPFFDVFNNVLASKEYANIRYLFLCEHENIQCSDQENQKKIRGDKNEISEESKNQILLYRFRPDEYREGDHLVAKRCIRAIRWILYYDHFQIFKKLLELAKTNHDEETFFGSDIDEQTQLLILAFMSKNAESVELVLQGVTEESINNCLTKKFNFEDFENYKEMIVPFHSYEYLNNSLALDVACRFGDIISVKLLVEKGAKVDIVTEDDYTPLGRAALHGHIRVVKYLIENKKADVNLQSRFSKTPLYAACFGGNADIVNYLIEKDCIINYSDDYRVSPIQAAVENGHLKIVKILVESGLDINHFNGKNKSPLFTACENGLLDIVEYLVEHNADVHRRSWKGQTALFAACDRNHVNIVEYLISNFGAEIEIKDEDHHTPFFIAACSGSSNVVEYLLRLGTFINDQDSEGNSPLHVASKKGNLEIVKCLIQNKADINIKNNKGRSPFLEVASSICKFDILTCLIRAGASVNCCDNQGRSPLFFAAKYGNLDLIKFILDNDGNIDTKSNLGVSPLQIALWKHKIDVVQFLAREKNKEGQFKGNHHLYNLLVQLRQRKQSSKTKNFLGFGEEDGLYHVFYNSSMEGVTYLLNIGLNPNQEDFEGNTILKELLKNNNISSMQKWSMAILLYDHGAYLDKSWLKLKFPIDSSIVSKLIFSTELKGYKLLQRKLISDRRKSFITPQKQCSQPSRRYSMDVNSFRQHVGYTTNEWKKLQDQAY